MIRTTFAGWRENRCRHLQEGVTGRLIQVVVFGEHGRRKNHVGKTRGVGHELLMHTEEQIFAQQAFSYDQALWSHNRRIGVLDEHGRHGRAAA